MSKNYKLNLLKIFPEHANLLNSVDESNPQIHDILNVISYIKDSIKDTSDMQIYITIISKYGFFENGREGFVRKYTLLEIPESHAIVLLFLPDIPIDYEKIQRMLVTIQADEHFFQKMYFMNALSIRCQTEQELVSEIKQTFFPEVEYQEHTFGNTIFRFSHTDKTNASEISSLCKYVFPERNAHTYVNKVKYNLNPNSQKTFSEKLPSIQFVSDLCRRWHVMEKFKRAYVFFHTESNRQKKDLFYYLYVLFLFNLKHVFEHSHEMNIQSYLEYSITESFPYFNVCVMYPYTVNENNSIDLYLGWDEYRSVSFWKMFLKVRTFVCSFMIYTHQSSNIRKQILRCKSDTDLSNIVFNMHIDLIFDKYKFLQILSPDYTNTRIVDYEKSMIPYKNYIRSYVSEVRKSVDILPQENELLHNFEFEVTTEIDQFIMFIESLSNDMQKRIAFKHVIYFLKDTFDYDGDDFLTHTIDKIRDFTIVDKSGTKDIFVDAFSRVQMIVSSEKYIFYMILPFKIKMTLVPELTELSNTILSLSFLDGKHDIPDTFMQFYELFINLKKSIRGVLREYIVRPSMHVDRLNEIFIFIREQFAQFNKDFIRQLRIVQLDL